MLIVFLLRLSLSWKSLAAHRFVQYHTNLTNSTVLGSMRVAMDHEIAAFTSKPNPKHSVFVPLASAHIETITKHLNATSPVIFLVDSESRETSELESLLIGTSHKAPIYFPYDIVTLPEGFAVCVKRTTVETGHRANLASKSGFIGQKGSKLWKLNNAMSSISSAMKACQGSKSSNVSDNIMGRMHSLEHKCTSGSTR
jgi:hypothetical protein